jgi:hypothetical protein
MEELVGQGGRAVESLATASVRPPRWSQGVPTVGGKASQ